MTEKHDLVEMARHLRDCKECEADAKALRIKAEEAIIAATGFRKLEGQTPYHADTARGHCLLVLKQPVATSVDDDLWEALRKKLPSSHPGRKLFLRKYALDLKAARKLQEKDDRAWLDVVRAVTRKPGKVSVEVKELDLLEATP